MTHYCGRPPKIDEIDILSWLTCLMGLPIKPDCSFTHACFADAPPPHTHTLHRPPLQNHPPAPYSQVHSGCANLSRLTVIIRVMSSADIWYRPSPSWIVGARRNNSGALAHSFGFQNEVVPPHSHTRPPSPPLSISIHIYEIFPFFWKCQQGGRCLGFLPFCLSGGWRRSWDSVISLNNLYLLKRHQAGAGGVRNVIWRSRWFRRRLTGGKVESHFLECVKIWEIFFFKNGLFEFIATSGQADDHRSSSFDCNTQRNRPDNQKLLQRALHCADCSHTRPVERIDLTAVISSNSSSK